MGFDTDRQSSTVWNEHSTDTVRRSGNHLYPLGGLCLGSNTSGNPPPFRSDRRLGIFLRSPSNSNKLILRLMQAPQMGLAGVRLTADLRSRPL